MLRPHSSKSCRNTTRTRGVAAKRISASSWGQCASFRCSGHVKKHKLSLQKLTFCPRARWAAAHRILVNKIENLLVSSIKITSPDRDDRDRSRDVRRSHLPLKLKPLGAGGLWRAMVPLFCCFLTCGVVCESACSPRGGERREEVLGRWWNIRPLVSPGPSTEKSKRRI